MIIRILFTALMSMFFLVGIYAQSISDIHGNSMNLDSCAGKKILLVILPQQQDTSLDGQMLRFQRMYSGQVFVIGLVSGDPDSLSSQYTDLISAGIFISQGIPDSVDAADPRGSVVRYLSRVSRNSVQDPDSIGNKYFVSEKGNLYADGAYNMCLDSPMVNNIIRTQMPGAF